jgi:hypothetical protein
MENIYGGGQKARWWGCEYDQITLYACMKLE